MFPRIVLGVANRVLGLQRHQARWSVESVHTKNIVSILHLLVALARHFRAPIRLPENVVVDVVIVTKREGVLTHRVIAEELTGSYDDVGMRCERDAFDTLFDHAPDKLMVVKKSLITFVNKHLNKVNNIGTKESGWMHCILSCIGMQYSKLIPLLFYVLQRTICIKLFTRISIFMFKCCFSNYHFESCIYLNGKFVPFVQINLEVADLDSQFADGVYLCLLCGLLDGYFVPLYDFHLTPQVMFQFISLHSLFSVHFNFNGILYFTVQSLFIEI